MQKNKNKYFESKEELQDIDSLEIPRQLTKNRWRHLLRMATVQVSLNFWENDTY